MTPDQVARELDQTAQRLASAAARGVERALSEVVMPAAIRWSSGPGQPPGTYRRGGGGGVDLGLINRRKGRFVAGWEKGPVSAETGEVRGSVVNTAPFAGFLARGTSRMVARPLPERVVGETEAEVARIVGEEIGRVI
jgi:hypothetical protein